MRKKKDKIIEVTVLFFHVSFRKYFQCKNQESCWNATPVSWRIVATASWKLWSVVVFLRRKPLVKGIFTRDVHRVEYSVSFSNVAYIIKKKRNASISGLIAQFSILVYDLLTGKIARILYGHSACVRDVSWHPTDPHIISSSVSKNYSTQFMIWSPQNMHWCITLGLLQWDNRVAKWQYRCTDRYTDSENKSRIV